MAVTASVTRAELRKVAARGEVREIRDRLNSLASGGPSDDDLRRTARGKEVSDLVGPSGLGNRRVESLRQARLERILRGNELTNVNYLELGVVSGQAVGRVTLWRNGRPHSHGTGFLVAPGVLMTNEHVLSNATEVAESRVQFRYEHGLSGEELTPAEFRFRTDVPPIFDVTNDLAIVGVEAASATGETLDGFGWVRLDATPGKAILGEHLTIIQHPGGERKQVSVRENRLIDYDPEGQYLWYSTDTGRGSSGSPVFNNLWDVVGLHHAGVPDAVYNDDGSIRHYLNDKGLQWTPDQGEDALGWYANEGIRISRIVAFLGSKHPNHPLARAVLDAPPPDVASLRHGRATGGVAPDGRHLAIPISLRIGGVEVPIGRQPTGDATPATPSAPAPAPAVASRPADAVDPALLERTVAVDQDSYGAREGYQSTFLGTASKYRVSLPSANKAAGTRAKAGGRVVADYWNYSIEFRSDRRLAYYSAANIDPGQWLGTRPRDKWFHDTRYPDHENMQLGEAWYGEQTHFESDRRLNPFDRGHLTARQDLQWGPDLETAERNGNDSYHWTNCAPHHWRFNQHGLWRGLEQQAAISAGRRRMLVFNGPIFDAPLSEEVGGVYELREGDPSPDPTFGSVAIPKQFFKVIAWVGDDEELHASGFIVTQEDLLRGVERIRWPAIGIDGQEAAGLDEGEIFLYQRPIARIAELTGLRFDRDLFRNDVTLIAQEGTTKGLIGSPADICWFGLSDQL